MSKIRLYSLLILIFSYTLDTGLAIDDTEYSLQQENAPMQVRWDNILNTSYLLAAPSHNKQFIQLEEKEEIILQLDAYSSLRVHGIDQDITADMFDVKVSNGSGLYQAITLSKTDSSKDLVLFINENASIVRISLKQDIKLKLGMFAARYEPIAQFAFYPDKISRTDGSTHRFLEYYDSPESVSFQQSYFLNFNQKLKINVKGPTYIELAARYIYDNALQDLHFPYNIDIKLDDKKVIPVTFIARPDYHDLYFNNLILSASDSYQLFVPDGKHQLVLNSVNPVLLKIHSLENSGYLFNANSKPKVMDMAVKLVDSKDRLLPSTIRNDIPLVMDNAHKTSGLSLANLSENILSRRKDNESLQIYDAEMDNIFTVYRKLLPTDSSYAKDLTLDWVIEPSLANLTRLNYPYHLRVDQIPAVLKYLIPGHFVKLNHKLDYKLPPLTVDSSLRVLVQQADLQSPVEVYVKYDQNLPQKLTFYPTERHNSIKYKPTGSLIALAALERNIPQEEQLGTLGGMFAQNRMPGYLKSAGIITLPLPANTHKISIWQKDKRDVSIALQYKDSKKFDLDDQHALQNMNYYKEDSAKIFIHALRFFDYEHNHSRDFSQQSFLNYLAKKNLADQTSLTSLYNDWLDLVRFLHERYLKFGQGLNVVDATFVGPIAKKTSVTKQEIKQAQEIQQNKQWNVAVNKWSNIIERGNLEEWRQAHLQRAIALRKSGESYLAERSLKALILNAKDSQVRLNSYKQLMAWYQERKYYYGLEGLIAAYYIKLGNDNSGLEKLTSILLQDDQQKLALELETIAPKATDDAAILLAVKNNRNKPTNLSKEDGYFWQGHMLAKNGLYDKAATAFGRAGEKGKLWQKHLELGINTKYKLKSHLEQVREEGFKEWLNWYYNHPGPKYYGDAGHLVSKFYESATLYSNSRDKYENSFIISPKLPVSLKAIGPAKIQIITRPLLDSNKNLLLKDSWVVIKVDGNPFFVKVNNYYTPNSFVIVGRPNVSLGIEQIFTTELSYGEHDITIESQSGQVIMHSLIEQPILALPVLPMPTLKTAEFIKNSFWQKQTRDDRDNYRIQYRLVNNYAGNSVSTHIADASNLRMNYQAGVMNLPDYGSINQEEVLSRLNKILFDYKTTKAKNLLVKAMQICDRHKGIYDLDQLCNSFESLSRWRPILTLDDNTEVIVKESKSKWDPENVNLSLRKDLITEDDDNSFVLSDTAISVVDFTNEDSTLVKLKAKMVKLIAQNPGKVTIGYQIDQGDINKIAINNSKQEVSKELNIDKGKHSLRIFLINPTQESFIKFELSEKRKKQDEEKDKGKDKEEWQQIDIKRKKKYFIASPDKPVKLTVVGPTMLTVHKFFDENNATVKNHYFFDGKNTLTLDSNKDQPAFYKIYEKIPANPKIADLQAVADIDYEDIPDALLHVNLQKPKPISFTDNLPLLGQEKGTWSLMAGAFSKLSENTVGETNNREKSVKYLEQLISYRYFSEIHRFYFYQDLFIRELKHGKLSGGFTTKLDYIPLLKPYTIFGELAFHTQHFNGKQNYSLFKELGVRSRVFTSRKLYHNASASVFDRNFSSKKQNLAQFLDANSATVDPDVYSNYINNYKRGIILDYKANFKPYLDNIIWAGVSWQSTNKFIKSNYVSYGVGVDQLIDQFVVGLDFSTRHYFKGDKRKLSFNRNQIGAYILFEQWLAAQNHRLEWGAKIYKIFDSNVSSKTRNSKFKKANSYTGALSLTWHLGNGRNYRDFMPWEIKFRQLKARRIPIKNEMKG